MSDEVPTEVRRPPSEEDLRVTAYCVRREKSEREYRQRKGRKLNEKVPGGIAQLDRLYRYWQSLADQVRHQKATRADGGANHPEGEH